MQEGLKKQFGSSGDRNNGKSEKPSGDWLDNTVKSAASRAGYNLDDSTAKTIGDGLEEGFKKFGCEYFLPASITLTAPCSLLQPYVYSRWKVGDKLPTPL